MTAASYALRQSPSGKTWQLYRLSDGRTMTSLKSETRARAELARWNRCKPDGYIDSQGIPRSGTNNDIRRRWLGGSPELEELSDDELQEIVSRAASRTSITKTSARTEAAWSEIRRRAGGSPELDEKREKAAEAVVLDRFDTLRSSAGHDYGAGQRAKELRNVKRELSSTPATTVDYIVEKELGLELSAGELLAAFRRLAGPRRRRIIERESYRRSTPATQRTLRTWDRLENTLTIAAGLEHNEEELIEIEPGILATPEAAAEIAPSVVERKAFEYDVAGETRTIEAPSMVQAQTWIEADVNEEAGVDTAYGPGLIAAGTIREIEQETDALKRTTERMTELDRRGFDIEQASDEELEAELRSIELELERRRQPDDAATRKELEQIQNRLERDDVSFTEAELLELHRRLYAIRDRVYQEIVAPDDLREKADDLLFRVRGRRQNISSLKARLTS